VLSRPSLKCPSLPPSSLTLIAHSLSNETLDYLSMKLALPRFSAFQWFAIVCLALMLAPLAIAAMSVAPHGKLALAATGSITTLELAKLNCGDTTRGFVEEHAGAIPEMQRFPAEQLGAGVLKYETLIRTGYPTAGFHDMGGGHANSKSSWRNETFECFPFGGRVEVVKHIADNNKRGGAAGLFAAEGSGIAKAAMFKIAQQIYYGRGGADAKGFPGLKNFTAYGTTFTDPLTGKTYSLYINGSTGATASTGSSVYAVKFNAQPEGQIPDGVTLTYGTGSVFALEDPMIESIVDPNDSTKKIRVYASDLQGFAGLIIPNQHCVRRIGNLSSDSNKGLTWTLMDTMWQSWPQGIKPDAILMSARSQSQLQADSTVVVNTSAGSARAPGQPTKAALPTEFNGVPIVITDAIGDTDAIEVAAASEE